MSRNRRLEKVRSSKKHCQEKFSCTQEFVEAEYECDECGTYQCKNCEIQLHGLKKFLFHDRKKLTTPEVSLLCQNTCSDKNFADVTCEKCNLNFCFDCFTKIHSHGKKKSHTRVPFNPSMETLEETFKLPSLPPLSEPLVEFDNDNSGDYVTMAGNLSTSPKNISTSKDDSSHRHDQLPSPKDGHFMSPQENHFMTTSTRSDQSDGSLRSIPDVATLGLGNSIPLDSHENDGVYKDSTSFPLINEFEKIQVKNEQEFTKALGCKTDATVKVLSIFGNTGDGKSHTLNHTFFSGMEVFLTSNDPSSCTAGVWAALDPKLGTIIMDTEGLLGTTKNQNQRTRLLLKILAVSDIVIYRTRADRLHNDMFQFLGDASSAYMKHFKKELKALSDRGKFEGTLSTLGPAVVVFHETQHTDVLKKESGNGKRKSGRTPEDLLKDRFHKLEMSIDAFSGITYVGTRTVKPPTKFEGLLKTVKSLLHNNSVRSPRSPAVIFKALTVLNEKFKGDIEKSVPCMFPDQYFTCSSRCLSCSMRCNNSMNHLVEKVPHNCDSKCIYQHQYDNQVFSCRACHNNGKEVIVVPKTAASTDNQWFGLAKYAWSGYVLECKYCGIIYKSRQYWYGNKDPIDTCVRTEIAHVWPGSNPVLQGTHNAARRLLDGVHYISSTVKEVSAKPTKMLTNWVTDQIAPPYWVPNSELKVCKKCDKDFTTDESKHHCRACGEGFCDDCSMKKTPVPERGWGPGPVRVCDECFRKRQDLAAEHLAQPSEQAERDLRARIYGEVVGGAIGAVAGVVEYPLEYLKDSAKPAYWVADNDITNCCVCKTKFTPKLTKHHCRACGDGVCSDCSPELREVPSRGWDYPVRVCNACYKQDGVL
ncbi:unnamed protein product [Owenia fusiformis]|uniref:Uncharacterized protein n=1 Tax=Owenia fusiformis TaxID=6347 RepID=A0A8J1U3P1_OWEFU|nr:unnamed protein product [Owenia fusiformis]